MKRRLTVLEKVKIKKKNLTTTIKINIFLNMKQFKKKKKIDPIVKCT